LPSVKSEKGGNDPTVVLVPTGGSGWAKDGEKPPGGVEDKGENHNRSDIATYFPVLRIRCFFIPGSGSLHFSFRIPDPTVHKKRDEK
jgi:hypothetical protein